MHMTERQSEMATLYVEVRKQSLVFRLCDTMDSSPPGSFVHGDSPGKSSGVCCIVLLQGIFLTQGLNLCLLHWQADSLPLSHQGSPHTV